MTKALEMAPEAKAERIKEILENLNALPKGTRSTDGRKMRANLRRLGFYLSKQEKEGE